MNIIGTSLAPRHVKKRAKSQAKRGDVILAIKTLRDGLQIPLGEAKDTVENWLRRWGKIKS